MHVTMKQIAQELGVSRVAVSHVINGREDQLSEATCQRIRKALEKYDYQPNALVRGLQNKKTGVIGVIVPAVRVSFFPDILNSLEQLASASGYQCLLAQSHSNHDKLMKGIDTFRQHRVDGMIICPDDAFGHKAYYKQLVKRKLPIVFLDCGYEGIDVPLVVNDNEACGYLATMHLLELGHTHIGCLRGTPDGMILEQRYAGYCKAMKKVLGKVNPHCVVQRPHWRTPVEQMIRQLFDTNPKLTAMVCMTDQDALRAMHVANEFGMRVPDDLSITGCANLDFAELVSPGLTTIDQKPDVIAQEAWRLLEEKIKNPKCTTKRVRVSPELIVRQSTAPLEK